MGFELYQRVRVVDRQSPFYNYIGSIEQIDTEEQRFTVCGRFKGWSPTQVYATFSDGQLVAEERDKIA